MRRQSRELALQVLFQTEFAPQISYQDLMDVLTTTLEQEVVKFADDIIKGVTAKKTEIDSKIQAASSHWKIERMATIDRNILRVAVYEIAFAPAPLKANIVINEAVEIAKKFGNTESAAFVNGLLDQVAKGH
ncbi:MAG: transcription antitermination factor NusB [Bdellovibrionaceae bacterium]|nr:transcription antitermination factor NusB [Pseudobdellovibrionaceae bacterium]